jgi:parallel beta-helix repeat protein
VHPSGIIAGDETTLTFSKAAANGGTGTNVGAGSVVTGNVAKGNHVDGIEVGGCVVSGNTATRNGRHGIGRWDSRGSIIVGNTASYNTETGSNSPPPATRRTW